MGGGFTGLLFDVQMFDYIVNAPYYGIPFGYSTNLRLTFMYSDLYN